MYTDLLSVLALLSPTPDEILQLPKRIDTLKKYERDQLPLLKMRQRDIQLDTSVLPLRSASVDKMVFFDMRHVFKCVLQSKAMVGKIHMGMSHLVDQPTEFYHSASWASSIRTVGGEFARYKNGKPIFPSDFVWYFREGVRHLCRISSASKDFTSDAKKNGRAGQKKLIGYHAYTFQSLPSDIKALAANIVGPLNSATSSTELFLVEDDPVMLEESDIDCHEDSVYLDYAYNESTVCDNHSINRPEKFIVRNIILRSKKEIRNIALSSPNRGELEIATYGRDYLETNFASGKEVISLPYTTFIDAFGLYNNMYRSIMGVYATFAFLDEYERSRRSNIFPITLGPYGSKWDEVVESLAHLRDLEKGILMTVNNREVFVCAPTLAYCGDMPQQQANSGCKSQNATYGCRYCLIPMKERANLRYDIRRHGRYHFETLRSRELASQLSTTRAKAFFSGPWVIRNTIPPCFFNSSTRYYPNTPWRCGSFRV